MTTYSVKLVDHRNSPQHETDAIKSSIQHVLGLAFVDTSDDVDVEWGSGANDDNLVIHFVDDVAHSYLRQTWPTMPVDPNAGGHTHSHGSLSGTELYRSGPRGPFRLRVYGFMAFHEALHNIFPFRNDVHTAMCGGLASAHVPHEDPNDDNKAWLRRGFSSRNPQLL